MGMDRSQGWIEAVDAERLAKNLEPLCHLESEGLLGAGRLLKMFNTGSFQKCFQLHF